MSTVTLIVLSCFTWKWDTWTKQPPCNGTNGTMTGRGKTKMSDCQCPQRHSIAAKIGGGETLPTTLPSERQFFQLFLKAQLSKVVSEFLITVKLLQSESLKQSFRLDNRHLNVNFVVVKAEHELLLYFGLFIHYLCHCRAVWPGSYKENSRVNLIYAEI